MLTITAVACGKSSSEETTTTSKDSESATKATTREETKGDNNKMKIKVNGKTFIATLVDNSSTEALVKDLKKGPMTLELSEYGGFEKVGPLGKNYPTNDQQITTKPGDIILYQGDQISLYYDKNSWSFTRLGKVNDISGWKDALGGGDVTVTLSLED